jgi:hypothetical protein
MDIPFRSTPFRRSSRRHWQPHLPPLLLLLLLLLQVQSVQCAAKVSRMHKKKKNPLSCVLYCAHAFYYYFDAGSV